MKYYAVSDIHSFYTPLVNALQAAGFFDDKEEHKLVVCGDLLDRGSEPTEVQNFICDLIDKDEVILIRGNHEDLMVDMLKDLEELLLRGDLAYSHYEHNGTVKTFLEMTGVTRMSLFRNTEKQIDRMVRLPFFTKILPKMRDFYETDNYIFVHGWIPCREAVETLGYYNESANGPWREADRHAWWCARWFSYLDAMNTGKIPEKTIICGHRSAAYGHAVAKDIMPGENEEAEKYRPFYGNGFIAIDGCTVRSGIVNCLVIED